jgi:arginase family enzyme
VGGLLRDADAVAILEGADDGPRELAEALGARVLGEWEYPEPNRWEADFAAAGPMFAALTAAVRDGARVFVTGSCHIAIATLPELAQEYPGLRIAWFDAHPDFNTPQSSPSGFLGGMPLSHACGVWGEGGTLDPERVHLIGIRDVDPGERQLLDAHRVHETPPTEGPVFVHLDLDVLDPSEMPARYPVTGGMSWDELGEALAALPDVVGIEITSCAAGHAARVAKLLQTSI